MKIPFATRLGKISTVLHFNIHTVLRQTNLTSIKSKLGQNLATDTNELQEQRT